MPLDGPDRCHCFATRRGARRLTRLYDQHLAPSGLTISQFTLLAMLMHERGLRLAELAERMVMDRTTVVRALRPLQTQGLVEARRPKTGRALELFLSRRGVRRVEAALPLWEMAQTTFEGDFGRARAARLRRALDELATGA